MYAKMYVYNNFVSFLHAIDVATNICLCVIYTCMYIMMYGLYFNHVYFLQYLTIKSIQSVLTNYIHQYKYGKYMIIKSNDKNCFSAIKKKRIRHALKIPTSALIYVRHLSIFFIRQYFNLL